MILLKVGCFCGHKFETIKQLFLANIVDCLYKSAHFIQCPLLNLCGLRLVNLKGM